ncbi:MAG: carboxypeptidase regulatory-like domain-containing protein, partial [Candidatus Acidiferrum sp.]
MFLLTPLAVFAQKTPKAASPGTSVKGTVTTQNGDVLAGATVKLAKNPPIGVPATAETDENGHYEFHNLQSGNYSLSIEGAGFKKTERAVLLKDGEQGVQDFSLTLETVAQTVQVSGMATIISTESSSAPVSVVTNTQLVTLPTQQEQVKEVIPITPGVVRTLDSKLVFKGSDENQSLLIINSTRNTDPVTGSFGITVPTDAVESFAVYKTPYDASLGSFSGGLTTIETKSPSDNLDFNITKLGITVLGKEGHMAGL